MSMFPKCGIADLVQACRFVWVGQALCAVDQEAKQRRGIDVTETGFDDETAERDLAIRVGLACLISHAPSPPIEPVDQILETHRWRPLRAYEIATPGL
jgi:hypothetical protein